MKQELEEVLLKLMLEEARLLVAGEMSDKERDWAVRLLATVQSDQNNVEDEQADSMSDEELMRIIDGNETPSRESILEEGQSELPDEVEAEGTKIVPFGKTK